MIYSKLPNASNNIIKVFKLMQSNGEKSDTIGYTSLLTALSKSKDLNAAIEATEVCTSDQM